MAIAANLGFPRIGARRQLKRAVEEYWAGNLDPEELQATAAGLRREHWLLQRSLGIEHIPSGDFSLFDHVLDTAAMLGAVPKRFAWSGGTVDLATYFAMARGTDQIPPLDMTKWFDTNYHYLVPEFEPDMKFKLASTRPVDHFVEAATLGIHTRPVLLGPLTFLLLGRCKAAKPKPLAQLDKLLPVYEEVLWRLAHAGADWVQVDEAALASTCPMQALDALESACARLSAASDQIRICLTTYFGGLGENLPAVLRLPVAAVHLDLVRAPEQLDRAWNSCRRTCCFAGGDRRPQRLAGRFQRALGRLERAAEKLGPERIMVAPPARLCTARWTSTTSRRWTPS